MFKCKHEDCPKKFISSDLDIHAARNILLHYLSRNKIMFRQPTQIIYDLGMLLGTCG